MAKTLIIIVLSLILPSSPAAAAETKLTCSASPGISVDEIGDARRGNLWTWDRREHTVDLWAGDASRISGFSVPNSRSLDLDRAWGLIRLDNAGTRLFVRRPGADEDRALDLTHEAADVIWIDQHRVAVAPTRAAHLVEIWNLDTGERERAFGEATRIVPEPGATFLRSLTLAYNAPLDRLFALNSLTGELTIFSLEGEVLATAQVPAHRYPEIESWRRELDAQLKQQGEIQTPLFEVLRMTVDDRGRAWIVSKCEDNRTTALLTRVALDGSLNTRTLKLDSPDCSLRSALIGEDVLFIPMEHEASGRILSRCGTQPETFEVDNPSP